MVVIPVVNVQDAEEAHKRVKTAAEFSDLIHLDISDGVFTPHISWGSPEELESVMRQVSGVKIEIHLMVSNPEAVIDAWLRTGLVKRAIIHLEAMTDSVYLLEKCQKYGVEAMLAINPGTEAERLLAHASDFQYFQLLAVPPGPAGQEIAPGIIDKIKFIRRNIPNAIIEIDGGIVPATAKLVKEAGADIVVSGSYIFGGENPRRAYEELLSS